MEKGRLLITGAGGYVGTALVGALEKRDCSNILCAERSSFDFQSLDSIRSYF